MHKDEIKQLKVKKNIMIFIVLFSVLALAIFYFLAHRYQLVNLNLLDGIYLFLVIGLFIAVVRIRNKVNYYVFRYNYLLMLEENLPPLKTKKAILSKGWQQKFVDEGFIKHVETSDYTIYYQIPNKESPYKDFGKSLLCIVVNNNPKLDLYGNTIQMKIKSIYEKIEKEHPRLKKEIVIQFKKYEKFNDEAKEELQKILTFKHQTFTLININVGYFPNKNEVYYLRPKQRYPNKYYYLACKLIEGYI